MRLPAGAHDDMEHDIMMIMMLSQCHVVAVTFHTKNKVYIVYSYGMPYKYTLRCLYGKHK